MGNGLDSESFYIQPSPMRDKCYPTDYTHKRERDLRKWLLAGSGRDTDADTDTDLLLSMSNTGEGQGTKKNAECICLLN